MEMNRAADRHLSHQMLERDARAVSAASVFLASQRKQEGFLSREAAALVGEGASERDCQGATQNAALHPAHS